MSSEPSSPPPTLPRVLQTLAQLFHNAARLHQPDLIKALTCKSPIRPQGGRYGSYVHACFKALAFSIPLLLSFQFNALHASILTPRPQGGGYGGYGQQGGYAGGFQQVGVSHSIQLVLSDSIHIKSDQI